MKLRIMLLAAAFLAAAGMPAFAQDQQQSSPEQAVQNDQAAPQRSSQQPLPGPAYAVPSGTRFLVALQDKLCTKDDRAGKRFRAITLEPLTASDGNVLPQGAEIQAHIDKVEPADKMGHARLWLTFDDIQTRAGRKPLVAQLIDAPGVHSVRVVYDHEGEIVAGGSDRKHEEEAVAMAAFAGAAPGVMAHNPKDAAMGAGIAAVTAFIATSGMGQELTVEKDTKLELVLARPLPLRRN